MARSNELPSAEVEVSPQDPPKEEASYVSAYGKMMRTGTLFWSGLGEQCRKFWELTARGTEPIAMRALEDGMKGKFADPESLKAMFEAGAEMQRALFEMYSGAMKSSLDFMARESGELMEATQRAVETNDFAPVDNYWDRKVQTLMNMEQTPEARERLKGEFGYHFENNEEYENVTETERAILYHVNPIKEGVTIDMTRRPMIIVSPYVLGDNISALLPRQGISYAHTYANEGIPTYVVHYKDILETEAVQEMNGEDFTLDLQHFSRFVRDTHGRPAVINGICQGGYLSLAALLSGKVNESEDGKEFESNVDRYMSCVTPVDLSKCEQFQKLSSTLPPALRSVDAAAITLPNGNKVVDGRSTSSGMLWKNIARDNPFSSYLASYQSAEKGPLSDYGAVVKEWLSGYAAFPVEIARLSEQSASVPLSAKGELPFKLFGKKLNLNYIKESGIKWHALIGAKDDVVELPAAQAAQGILGNYEGYSEHIADTGHIGLLTNPRFKEDILRPYLEWEKEEAAERS